jgi:hypothetical protein
MNPRLGYALLMLRLRSRLGLRLRLTIGRHTPRIAGAGT